MRQSIPPRLRAPVKMLLGGVVVMALTAAVYGPVTLAVLGPLVAALAAGYYVWGGRDGDMAAVLRHQADERQADVKLRAQALVGRVMTAAALVAYLVAFAVKATIWPYLVFLVLSGVTLFAGWALYRDHGDGHGDSTGVPGT